MSRCRRRDVIVRPARRVGSVDASTALVTTCGASPSSLTGGDPRRKVHAAPACPTFQEAAGKVLDLLAPDWRGAKTAQMWQGAMASYVYPAIGDKRIDRVTTRDLFGVVEPLWHTKRPMAGKLRSWFNQIFKHAIGQGWVTENPAGERLRDALPKASRSAVTRHHRALHHSEVGAAIRTIQEAGAAPAIGALFEYTVLTASRPSMARLATWDEVDTDSATWTIPATKMKQGAAQRVPLSSRALECYRKLRRCRTVAGCCFRLHLPPVSRCRKTLFRNV